MKGSEAAPAGTIYTCPMHPEVRQDRPGSCPKCGMTLEPLLPALGEDDENPELADFTRRFWLSSSCRLGIASSSVMPHLGQLPARSWRTSGCIGQVYTAAAPGPAVVSCIFVTAAPACLPTSAA